jgi:hypothetical protein
MQPRPDSSLAIAIPVTVSMGLEITGTDNSFPRKNDFIFTSLLVLTRDISIGIRLISSYVRERG